MFVKRLLSGVVLLAVALVTIISGGWILFLTLLAVSLVGMRELYKAVHVTNSKWNILETTGYLGILLYYLALFFLPEQFYLPSILLGLLLIMCVYVFTYPQYRTEQITGAFFGMVYVGVMLSFLYLTREMEGGAFLVWLIMLCSWGCDTCAYCVGVLIGKHKMAPVLSPKKSVEGAIGGVVGAALLGALYAWAVSRWNLQADHTPLMYGVICGAGALVSMVGDLAASAIKRQQNIKDYGKLIPGHGGILDRFDSVIFTAPVIYLLAAALF